MKTQDLKKNKTKVMLDANIFDKLINLDDKTLSKMTMLFEIYISITQWNEIQAYKKSKAYDESKFKKIEAVIKKFDVKSFAGYFGFSSGSLGFNQAGFASEPSLKHMKQIDATMNEEGKKPSETKPYPNRADAWLATIARDYGCIVITQDGTGKKKGLYQAIQQMNGNVLSFQEFLNLVEVNPSGNTK